MVTFAFVFFTLHSFLLTSGVLLLYLNCKRMDCDSKYALSNNKVGQHPVFQSLFPASQTMTSRIFHLTLPVNQYGCNSVSCWWMSTVPKDTDQEDTVRAICDRSVITKWRLVIV